MTRIWDLQALRPGYVNLCWMIVMLKGDSVISTKKANITTITTTITMTRSTATRTPIRTSTTALTITTTPTRTSTRT